MAKTKVDIFSGFLGAGKTTLIRKLIEESFSGQQVVLIENEYGEVNIDSGFLQDAGVEITNLTAGCICCTLVGDFGDALKKVVDQYHPDRILIEPSGVGKLSDVIRAVQNVAEHDDLELSSFVSVADAKKAKMYIKNFGEFYLDQITHAKTIVLSRTQDMSEEKLQKTVDLLREHNPEARIITTPWSELTGDQILEAMEGDKSFADKLLEQLAAEPVHEHHHHHDHDHEHEHEHEHDHEHHHDDECSCEHDHEHDDECGCEHHHHDHDDHEHHHDHDHEHHHEHEHHHDHDDECGCGHEHHHHHHGEHDADEVFDSWGVETPRKYTEAEILEALEDLDMGLYGAVLRAKGIVQSPDGKWLNFDYVPGEPAVREGTASYTGQICVIGAGLKQDKLAEVFHI